MTSLRTRYMGIDLESPVIAGASGLTNHMDSIKKIEEAGAGALVIASLFEEQIQLEQFRLEQELQSQEGLHAEMITLFPNLEHAGPEEHLMWVRKAKESVSIPVIASLNAVNRKTWADWAKRLADTGVDGLELNFYATPSDFERSGADVEREQIDIVREIKGRLSIPISVKLSAFYSNPLHFVRALDREGVGGFVLFNRYFQPDIDAQGQTHISPVNYSSQSDSRLPLRFAGLLSGEIQGDVCASTGIMEAGDVAKMLLAGAACIQTVSCLYKNGVSAIRSMVDGLGKWMAEKGYADIAGFRGRMSREKSAEAWIYTRAQYAKLLLHPEEVTKELRSGS